MKSPEEFLEKFYAVSQPDQTENKRMEGIPVKHKGKDSIVYIYMAGNRSTKFGLQFKNKIRRTIETHVLDAYLVHCDFAASFSNGACHFKMVEWTTSLRLRQCILKYGKIRRAMRIKITVLTEIRYEFHVILEQH